MGMHPRITATRFPRQSDFLGKRCEVIFHRDTSQDIGGEIIRDDMEDPFVTILALDDGRVVLGTECQYRVP